MTTVYIGLGSNIGDRLRFLTSAVDAISLIDGVEIKKCSSIYETKPVDYENQDDFLNCVIALKTTLSPYDLLADLQKIELDLQRKRTIRWGPRTIDIDILFVEGYMVESDILCLPHPRMLQRAFVLVPLCEIEPDLVISGKTVLKWLEAIDISGVIKWKQDFLLEKIE